jgi:hypothetical protein
LTALRAKRTERENALRAERLRESGKDALVNFNDMNTGLGETNIKKEANDDSMATTDFAADGLDNMTGIEMIKTETGRGQTGTDIITTAVQNQPSEQTPQELRDLDMSGDLFGDNLGSADFGNLTTDTDFDSMFNDATANDGGNLNFDLEFSTATAPDSNILSSNNVTTSTETNGDVAPSEDINSLLPGLESLVNVDGEGGVDDFAMLDIPETGGTGDASTNQQTTAGTSQPNNTALDTTIDDSFFDTDNMGDLGDSKNVNSFDFDDWFN